MRWITLLAFMLACLPLHAQELTFLYPSNDNTFSIEDSFSGYASLEAKAKWLDEEQEALKPEQALIAYKDAFGKLNTSVQEAGWLRVGLFNATYQTQHLVLSFGMVNLADVWILHENGGVEEQVGGLTKQGPWPEGWHDGSAIMQLDIPERHAVVVLARIVPDLSQTATLHVSVEDRLVWEDFRNNSRHWLQAGGIALMLGAAIALSAWVFKKENLHGWFLLLATLTQLFVTVQYGFWSHIFWADRPYIDQSLQHILLWIIPFAYWLYVKEVMGWAGKTVLLWASARALICAVLWLSNSLAWLHWFEQPSYLVDLAWMIGFLISIKNKASAHFKHWGWGASLFWLSALFSWAWMEWKYDGFYRPDLQMWEINSWLMLVAYLYVSLPARKINA